MGQVISGVPLFAGQATAPESRPHGYNILFNANSTSGISHVVEILQTPIVVRAFGLTGDKKITIAMKDNDGISDTFGPLTLNSKAVALDVNNTSIVIDLPGKFVFVLSGTGALGTVSAVFWQSGMPYWSYGLSDFAMAS